jgi:hypothetical protein
MLAQMLPLDLREYYALNMLLDVLFVRHGAVPDDWQSLRHYLPRLNSRGWEAVRGSLIRLGHIRIEDGMIRSDLVNARLRDLKRQRDASAMGGHIAQAKQKMRMERPTEPLQGANFSKPLAQPVEIIEARVKSTSSIQTPDYRDKEEKKEAPPSPPLESGAVVAKESGEEVKILISPYLAKQVQSRWRQ